MNSSDLRKRAAAANLKFKEPYAKMMARIEAGSRANWLAAIKKFYDVAEPNPYANLPLEQRMKIEAATDKELKAICRELCTEAINRDFVNYVSTGNEGNVGRAVYTALQ